jgi:hypothetical protein
VIDTAEGARGAIAQLNVVHHRPFSARYGALMSPDPTAPKDFDFIIGSWNVKHRRLKSRLDRCTDWVEFQGLSTTQKILGGFGNVEDNRLFFPEGEVRAAALRSFDRESKTWSIWWLDGRAPSQLDKPVVGSFVAGRGEFYTDDQLNGVPITVRFVWSVGDGTRPTWEQAFSSDGGNSWETNWTMEFARSRD